jgi:hypothetical protein
MSTAARSGPVSARGGAVASACRLASAATTLAMSLEVLFCAVVMTLPDQLLFS